MKRIIAFIFGIAVVLFSGCAINEQSSFDDSNIEDESSSSLETDIGRPMLKELHYLHIRKLEVILFYG